MILHLSIENAPHHAHKQHYTYIVHAQISCLLRHLAWQLNSLHLLCESFILHHGVQLQLEYSGNQSHVNSAHVLVHTPEYRLTLP